MTKKNLILFFTIALFWGGSFLAIKFAISTLPPFFAAGLRVLLATLIALTVMRMRGLPWPREKHLWLQSAGIGLFGMGIPWALLFWGEQFVQPALASILNATVPVFTAIFSLFALKNDENIRKSKSAGVLFGFLGIVAIFAPQVSQRGGSADHSMTFGLLAIVGMAVSYGINVVWMRRFTGKLPFNVNLSIQGITACTFLFIISLLVERQNLGEVIQQGLTPQLGAAMVGLIYLGVFSTYLAWKFFFTLIERMGAVSSAAVTFVVPLLAIGVDWVTFKKWPAGNQWLGLGLIFAGLALINLKSIARRAVGR